MGFSDTFAVIGVVLVIAAIAVLLTREGQARRWWRRRTLSAL